MIRAGEIRKGLGQIQFSLAVLDTSQLQPKPSKRVEATARSFARNEMDFSGSQVLAGFVSALGGVSLLIWAVVRLWLFE